MGSNVLFTEHYLAPPCTSCPSCNEQMSLKKEYACLVLTERGEIEYARHPLFRCQRNECELKPTRTYDSMFYKTKFRGQNILVRELIRSGGKHNQLHHLRPEFVQCSSRFFVSWRYLEEMSLRLASSRCSILTEAKNLLYKRYDEYLAGIPSYLRDNTFNSMMETLKQERTNSCAFLRYDQIAH